ncbi:MAG TPA: hypothetical protein VER26_13195 [Xanthobacteraceae bacterium]|nr:hypothetical protein [Xanthobacteraceae bacterium]
MKIQKADEIADFTSHLGEIDDIFLESSARRDFCSPEEKQSFREMSLGRYIAKHRDSFFVALDKYASGEGHIANLRPNRKS